MTHSIYCDSGRQPCPTPRSCGEGCNFNCCTSTKLFTDNSDSSNPGYPFELLDAPGNFWDSLKWWQKVLVVCGLIVVCGMVAGVLTGHGK